VTVEPSARDNLVRQVVNLLEGGKDRNDALHATDRAEVVSQVETAAARLRRMRDQRRGKSSPAEVKEQLSETAEAIDAAAKRVRRLSVRAERRLAEHWQPPTPSSAAVPPFVSAFTAGLRFSMTEDLERMAQAARSAAAAETPKTGRRPDAIRKDAVLLAVASRSW
jgi:hypothetical protein